MSACRSTRPTTNTKDCSSTEVIHTSGHASVADLKRFAAALAPQRLVPIHSFETERFAEFFDNVMQQDDAAWWEV